VNPHTDVCFNAVFRTMFLDHDWFTLETASTLIANHNGLLHVPQPVPVPDVVAEPVEPVPQPQQHGKQKQAKQQKQQDHPSPAPPPVPLSPVEAAAAALSGTKLFNYIRQSSG